MKYLYRLSYDTDLTRNLCSVPIPVPVLVPVLVPVPESYLHLQGLQLLVLCTLAKFSSTSIHCTYSPSASSHVVSLKG